MNPGLIIEGFVLNAKRRVFKAKIDRHHPEVSWATADVSGNPDNFDEIKPGVQRSLDALKHELYHEENHDELLGELDELTEQIKRSTSPNELSKALDEARSVLNRAFTT